MQQTQMLLRSRIINRVQNSWWFTWFANDFIYADVGQLCATYPSHLILHLALRLYWELLKSTLLRIMKYGVRSAKKISSGKLIFKTKRTDVKKGGKEDRKLGPVTWSLCASRGRKKNRWIQKVSSLKGTELAPFTTWPRGLLRFILT